MHAFHKLSTAALASLTLVAGIAVAQNTPTPGSSSTPTDTPPQQTTTPGSSTTTPGSTGSSRSDATRTDMAATDRAARADRN